MLWPQINDSSLLSFFLSLSFSLSLLLLVSFYVPLHVVAFHTIAQTHFISFFFLSLSNKQTTRFLILIYLLTTHSLTHSLLIHSVWKKAVRWIDRTQTDRQPAAQTNTHTRVRVTWINQSELPLYCIVIIAYTNKIYAWMNEWTNEWMRMDGWMERRRKVERGGKGDWLLLM